MEGMNYSLGNSTETLNSSTSNTNEELPDVIFWEEIVAFKVSKFGLEALVMLLGALGNAAVILVVSFKPNLNNVFYFYLRNLAVADVMVLLVSFPLALVKVELMYRWPLGKFACEGVLPLSDTALGVSAWSIAAIALERYRAIVRFEGYNSSLKTAQVVILILWLASFLILSLPMIFVTSVIEVNEAVICLHKWPNSWNNGAEKVYQVMSTFYLYVIPLVIVSWTYFQLTGRINESKFFNSSLYDEKSGNARAVIRQAQQRIQVVVKAKKLLTPVVVIFAVTMFPMNLIRVFSVCYAPLLSYKYFPLLLHVCFFLGVINFACNPVIYSIVSKQFRKAFKDLLHCKPTCGCITCRCLLPKYCSLLNSQQHARNCGLQANKYMQTPKTPDRVCYKETTI